MTGKQLKRIQLKDNGKGSVILNANEFFPGSYIYTLLIDNQEVSSKKMIITD